MRGVNVESLSAINDARDLKPACCCDTQVVCTATKHAGVTNSDAGFGADQPDLAGIHTTQLTDVNRKRRLTIAARDCHGLQIAGADFVAAGDDVQLTGMQCGVDLHRTRQYVGVVSASRI